MKRSLILLLIISTSYACSILKPTVAVPELHISGQQYENMIHEAATEILAQGWLSDYLTTNNERPILMVGQFQNSAKVLTDINSGYAMMEAELIESGQVRVVSSNEVQRIAQPTQLLKGQSVDYVITSNFEKVAESSNANIIFVVSLWGNAGLLPIIEVKKELSANLTE